MKTIKLPKWTDTSFVFGSFLFTSREFLDSWEVNYLNIIWQQRKELLFIGRPIIFVIDSIIRILKVCFLGDTTISLKSCFDQEAETYTTNLAYCLFRPIFGWLNYFGK